jgi:general secretion pathway protein I
MVSVSIISIVLVSIIRLQGQTISMNETIRFYTMAPFLANTKMSEINLNPDSFDSTSSGEFGENFPGYTWKTQIEEIKIEAPESPEISLKQVDVFISFNDGEIKFSMRRYLNAESGEGDD